jgi:SAGA-associated factor 11
MLLFCVFLAQAHELVFLDLLDSVIVDVATEAHRGAKLGLDPRLDHDDEADQAQLLAHARAIGNVDVDVTGSDTGKHAVDVFGLSHPAIANETLDCMNCGRPIVAGRFAPHLEKCMGKVSISSLSVCAVFVFLIAPVCILICSPRDDYLMYLCYFTIGNR